MKRVFFFGVIVYSVAILLLNDWPGAVNSTGTAALPWMAKCLVDFSFAAFGLFKMFGSQIHWDDDEVGVHPDDVSVSGYVVLWRVRLEPAWEFRLAWIPVCYPVWSNERL